MKPIATNAQIPGAPFGSDLHGFIEQYERAYPDEVLHIEEPLNAEWEISALAMKLEKAHRFPLLVFHNVIVDGKRATMPLTTFLMASRLRLARAMATEVQKAGIACYERAQTRQRPIVVSRDQSPVKQVVEKGRAPFSGAAPSPHGSRALYHRRSLPNVQPQYRCGQFRYASRLVG